MLRNCHRKMLWCQVRRSGCPKTIPNNAVTKGLLQLCSQCGKSPHHPESSTPFFQQRNGLGQKILITFSITCLPKKQKRSVVPQLTLKTMHTTPNLQWMQRSFMHLTVSCLAVHLISHVHNHFMGGGGRNISTHQLLYPQKKNGSIECLQLLWLMPWWKSV
jgi:hypothetical protein